jgi:hypothetical protein
VIPVDIQEIQLNYIQQTYIQSLKIRHKEKTLRIEQHAQAIRIVRSEDISVGQSLK